MVLASVYALRLFITAMHNRVGPSVRSREIPVRDGAVLVPRSRRSLFLALYPQLALHRSEGSVKRRAPRSGAAPGSPPARPRLGRRRSASEPSRAGHPA